MKSAPILSSLEEKEDSDSEVASEVSDSEEASEVSEEALVHWEGLLELLESSVKFLLEREIFKVLNLEENWI